jgi:hypothetical protein
VMRECTLYPPYEPDFGGEVGSQIPIDDPVLDKVFLNLAPLIPRVATMLDR